MKIERVSAALMVAACAGAAVAQPTVDGRLSPGELELYRLKWVQSNPTQFGDNVPGGACNEADVGNPAAVSTGHELKIPLARLGNPTGPVRVLVAIANGGHSSFSNQTLPGLPAGTANLGSSRQVDFTQVVGNQFVTIPVDNAFSPVADGTRSVGEYGAALAVQTNRTGFGNNTDPDAGAANGSELDNLHGVISGDFLHLFIGGNIGSDFGAKIEIFIDSGVAGGLNQLTQFAALPDVDFGALQNMQGNDASPGLRFDAGFNLTHYITYGAGNNPVTYFPNLANVAEGFGEFLGCNQAGNGSGILAGCGAAPDVEVALDNSNIDGVPGRCPPPTGDRDVASGSELNNLYSYLDLTNNRLHLFIGGNLQNNFNKITLFFDVAEGGQNTLTQNIDIDFGALQRMGANFEGDGSPGLTFDADFAADYWLNITNGNDPIEQYTHATVIRTDGPRRGFNGEALDYGTFEGGPKARIVDTVRVNDPVNWDGRFGDPYNERLDIQDGFAGSIFANYAPRLAGDSLLVDPFNPVGTPGLILNTLDNSNIGGVTSSAADPVAAQCVDTGYELSIDLDELGWDGSRLIRVAGMILSSGYDFMSNQVLGGLPDGTGNLGNTRQVNFAAIEGAQYIVLNGDDCPADFNGDAFLDFFDLDAYIACFEGESCPAGKSPDFNGDCFVDFFDLDAFVEAFENGC